MKEGIKDGRPSVFIETYGCQMNKYDSEIVTGILTSSGYRLSKSIEEADIILINTCSVRDHAEKRALGRISALNKWKKSAPHKKIGVLGCMAQRMGKELLDMKPFIDCIVGPDEYGKLPHIIDNGQHGSCIQTHLNMNETYSAVLPYRKTGFSGWVAISRGCNNYCSYCIVPYTRGRERSRPTQEILREIEQMAEQGFREVVLLGQNVNTYNDGRNNFADILEATNHIQGIIRIRFMTSHPKDLSDRILEVVASNKKLCQHIHLPVQSGSNRILSRMNRMYTRERYLQLIKKARTMIPGVAITTDILVGFPGETESDFLDTCNLMKEVRFEEAFTYRFSSRPGTKAAQLASHLSEQERLDRLNHVINLQRRITLQKKREMIGQCVEVLPECTSKQSSEEWMGRTSTNHVVVFPKGDILLGQPVKIFIETCKGSTLRGKIESKKNASDLS
jgi:tRNA-2-methylthio-N6-dimethylallyladenosine synthase